MSVRHHVRKRSAHHRLRARKKARKVSKRGQHSHKVHAKKLATTRAKRIHLMKVKKLRPPKRHGEVTH